MSDNEIDEGYNKCIKEYKSRFEWDNEENLKFTPEDLHVKRYKVCRGAWKFDQLSRKILRKMKNVQYQS
ncbi:uncharacterized protein OCT59_028331 [Rhizophagus irregularis]|uniref:uncharacterized protein n=1 Tax=Rhizophagus irregularis TaxID=588596 RepID=UPI0019F7BAC8|nr:hypothetical protein OCT59_028331 [Rhizophagus irregularis]GBC43559.2 hypothetical protein GLOIN_2v1882275 [Rhizophagus irregularis DAOM 181602=DAOM 197198]